MIYICKEPIHIYPPVLTQLCLLSDMGYEVVLVTSKTTKNIEKILQDKQITVNYIKNKRIKIPFVGKMLNWFSYRRRAYKSIKILDGDRSNESLIWFGTADSVIPLYGKLKKMNYVLSILELYDTYPLYKYFLSRIVKKAKKIIECEENRAYIHASWWNLKEIPSVIPNKPYYHQREQRLPANNQTQEAVNIIKDKKFILYQGIITPDRDVSVIAKALDEINSDYYLVLIGSDRFDGVKKIKELYRKTIYLGYIPAPDHLIITSFAKYGIAFYDYSSMNNLFCAPNKIFEYTGFGIPVIGNYVPGLINTIQKYDAGILVDINDYSDVVDKIRILEDNYPTYSENAKVFFESIELHALFQKITKNLNIRKRF